MEIEKRKNMRIRVTGDDGGFIEKQSIEACLMFAILEKLEEMRCCIIDVEDAIARYK